jgi:predicted transcriptional regulator
MEGGEVVITRNAVSDNTKREFNGEMLTNREILSKINESGGGVSFADGGDIPETISTSGKEYKYGGKMMKDHEIVSSCGCNHSMAEGGLVYKKIYNRGGGGYTTIINGMEYSINKQYGKGTWVAQSDDGEYYKEAQTLSDLKYYLENLKKDSKDSYADGGETDYMISKKGNREYPEYVIERTDGSEMISMFFDSEKEAKDYADKKGYKITKKGYNMAEGGETDYHNEIKNHLFPKVEVEVEVEVEPEMDLIPINEHYITADDLGLSDGMPMLAVGTIIYSSGGNDQWEVVSFSDDGVNLVNNPKSPLQSKMEDKHLTFEELIKYFKDKAISIKNISTERELEPAIALVKNKLPQKSFAFGGFIDGDEDEDAKIMQSQFGKSNFK